MKRRGFTLLEMMVVVAIVGILSAMAAGGIRRLIAVGRVNGSAASVSRMMANGRMRALGMACRIGVQVNGPTYAPVGMIAGFPYHSAYVYVFQKGNCAADETQAAFSTIAPVPPALGDRVVASFPMAEQRTNTQFLEEFGGVVLTNNAVLVSWGVDSTGNFTRTTYTDAAGSGTFTAVVPDVAGDLNIKFTSVQGPEERTAIVPLTGAAYLEY